MSFGIGEKYTFGVSVNLGLAEVDAQKDPCDAAVRVAGMVVAKLKQRGACDPASRR